MFMLRLLCVSTLSIAVLAGRSAHFRSRQPRHASSTKHVRANESFALEVLYEKEDFLNQWDFFDGDDPTHGNVNYLSKEDAIAKKLAFVQDDGTTVLAVDNTTTLKSGDSRNSVRISSKRKFDGGLFIADFWAMPHGCSVWPAYWTLGDNWPNNGEVDILEGVNESRHNQYTLHTSAGCTASTSGPVSGTQLGTKCESSGADNSGCAFKDEDQKSYGEFFNRQAGGVYAHLWDSTGIKIWRFSRKEVPEDILSRDPQPSTWGEPAAEFSNDTCDMKEHFKGHSLVINTTLCGDFAGSAYPGPEEGGRTCKGSCADAVADPNNFTYARWMIRNVAVYQRK
ncbi:glycoside hydrolase family 16 protein [Flagelloscypha sp. PMI_526]|nr:glycoside hydrolase family 16 protein [Flagelloscypha sp. PMI_526]